MDGLLHPFLVHLPLGLALLTPLLVLLLAVLEGKGKLTPSAWLAVLLVQVLLVAGSLAAMKSGEGEEERVERALPEAALHVHEEAAELFVWCGVAGLVLAVVMVLPLGSGLRRVVPFMLLGVSLVTLALGLRTGKFGGELVYRHLAASARAGVPAGTAELPSVADAPGQESRRAVDED